MWTGVQYSLWSFLHYLGGRYKGIHHWVLKWNWQTVFTLYISVYLGIYLKLIFIFNVIDTSLPKVSKIIFGIKLSLKINTENKGYKRETRPTKYFLTYFIIIKHVKKFHIHTWIDRDINIRLYGVEKKICSIDKGDIVNQWEKNKRFISGVEKCILLHGKINMNTC